MLEIEFAEVLNALRIEFAGASKAPCCVNVPGVLIGRTDFEADPAAIETPSFLLDRFEEPPRDPFTASIGSDAQVVDVEDRAGPERAEGESAGSDADGLVAVVGKEDQGRWMGGEETGQAPGDLGFDLTASTLRVTSVRLGHGDDRFAVGLSRQVGLTDDDLAHRPRLPGEQEALSPY